MPDAKVRPGAERTDGNFAADNKGNKFLRAPKSPLSHLEILSRDAAFASRTGARRQFAALKMRVSRGLLGTSQETGPEFFGLVTRRFIAAKLASSCVTVNRITPGSEERRPCARVTATCGCLSGQNQSNKTQSVFHARASAPMSLRQSGEIDLFNENPGVDERSVMICTSSDLRLIHSRRIP